jgi:adenylate cyclase
VNVTTTGGLPVVHSRLKGETGLHPGPREVLEQLARIFESRDFDASPRSRGFLRYIVEEALAGRQERLTQAAIATKVFDRREDFDPTVDPIVRIQAGRLRRSLERYYLLAGPGDPVRIELPRGGYVPVMRRTTPSEKTESRAAEDPGAWPSVFLQVEGGSGREIEEAVARFPDHLALELGRYGDVRVFSRPESDGPSPVHGSGASFSLTTHLTAEETGLRATVRLVDRRSQRQVWAEEYRSAARPTAAFCAETARVVAARVASEQGEVARLLWAERRGQPPAEPTPYGAILASYQFFFNRDPADLATAVKALQSVVAAEPECSLAWVQLSRLYTANNAFDIAPLETPIEEAVAYAETGVRLNASSQRARTALAGALLVKGELAASRAVAQGALELNPDSLVYLEWIGWLLTMLGDWERGPDLVRQALDRNPYVIPVAHHALWLAHLHRGELEEAYQAALQYRDPAFFWRSLMRVCCLGHLGRLGPAKVEVAELLQRKPDFARRGRTLIGRLLKFPDLHQHVVDGLEKAGLVLEGER